VRVRLSVAYVVWSRPLPVDARAILQRIVDGASGVLTDADVDAAKQSVLATLCDDPESLRHHVGCLASAVTRTHVSDVSTWLQLRCTALLEPSASVLCCAVPMDAVPGVLVSSIERVGNRGSDIAGRLDGSSVAACIAGQRRWIFVLRSPQLTPRPSRVHTSRVWWQR
jgi:hypothetical protein